MQSTTSVADYERLYANVSDEDEVFVSENTPLLPRQSQSCIKLLRPFIFTGILLLILIPGIIIGVYLLVEDGRELPINIAFELVSREEWGAKLPKRSENLTTKPASHVILTKSATPPCESRVMCSHILINLQNVYQGLHNLSDVPFNFLIGGDGVTYEGRGWDIRGDVSKDLDGTSISIAIIGNVTSLPSSSIQMKELNALLDESVRRKKLQRSYKIIKKNL